MTMILPDTTSDPARNTPRTLPLRRILRAASSPWRRWRRRRNFLRLLDLDPNILDDIGVTREEVERAAGLPLSRNAAVELERTALQRRRKDATRIRR